MSQLNSLLENAPKKKANGKVQFGLSSTMLVLVCIALLLTVGWAFYMGFLVGRGEDPGKKLENILHKEKVEEPKKQPVIVQETAKQVEIAEQKEEIKSAPPPKEEIKPVHPFTRPSDSGKNAWKENSRLAEQPKKPAKEEQKKQPQSGQERYKVLYQLATYDNQSKGENLVKKCAQKGLKAYVKPFGKMFRVLLSFQGTEEQAKALKATLASIGVKQCLILQSISVKPRTP